MKPETRLFLRIARRGLVAVALVVLIGAAFTRYRRSSDFMGFLKEREKPQEALPALSQARLLEQLRNLDLSVTPTDREAKAGGRSFFLCQEEKRGRDEARVANGVLTVRAEVDATTCGAGLGRFEYVLACPGEPDNEALGEPAHSFFHRQGFNFAGEWESRCLERGGGSTRFALLVSIISGPHRVLYTIDRGEDGEPCHVSRVADGSGPARVIIKDCRYRNRNEASKTEVVETLATAKDMQAQLGDRFYRGGSMSLSVNDWKGEVQFSDPGRAPVVQLSNGRETMTSRLGGAFTDP